MEQLAVNSGLAPTSTLGNKLKRLGIGGQILSLVILAVVFGLGTGGRYFSLDNIHAILGLAGIPALLCLGLHQVIIIGGMDMSLEGVVAICAVVVGLLLKNGVNAMDIGILIVPVVMAVGGGIGLVSGVVHTRMKMPSFIATLGINWVFYGLAVLISGGQSIPIQDLRFQTIVSGSHILGIPNIFIIAVVFTLLFEIFQNRTKTGVAMYAVGGDETLAGQAGINVSKIKMLVFMMAGVVYGLAGLFLVSRLNSSAARIGNLLLFPAMTAVAVGGVSLTGGLGKARNALLGTVIISALNNGLVMMQVNPYIQEAVNGIVLIIAVAVTIDRKKLGFIK